MAGTLTDPARVAGALPANAMALRGAFHPRPDDAVPGFADGTPTATLVLLGWTGGAQWPAFAASAEAQDGLRHPLDRWSRRLIDAAASALDAIALYPFGGPPYHGFQCWGLRAESLSRAPIGLLIHPGCGLWHVWRVALGFRQPLALTPAQVIGLNKWFDNTNGRKMVSLKPDAFVIDPTAYWKKE